MTFISPPSEKRGPHQPEAKISAAPQAIEQLVQEGKHVARLPRFPQWHPASARGRRLLDAQENEPETVVEEQAPEEDVAPTGRLSKVPPDLLEHINASTSPGHSIGGDARLETTRFGKHRVVVGEDGEQPLHPGLAATNDQPISSRKTMICLRRPTGSTKTRRIRPIQRPVLARLGLPIRIPARRQTWLDRVGAVGLG